MTGNNFKIHLSFNSLSGGFLQAFMARSRDKIMAIFEKDAATEAADAGLAQTAAALLPNHAKEAEYFARQPYAKPEYLEETIAGAEQRGWITRKGQEFTATKKAVALNDQLIQLLEEDLNPLAELTSVDIDSVVAQLSTCVETAQKVSLPLKPTFTFARNFEYEDKTPTLTWVRRHLITLNSYRDDCHLSSWQHHQLPGYVWETLSFIWEGEITTAEKLAETLSGYRGYQQEDYQDAIEQLIELEWVTAQEDQYVVTDLGRKVREESEELTNQHYVKAFSALSEKQMKSLNSMLETITTEISPEPQKEQ
jgi:DNA-binding MarR family transcriptional regulator